MSGFFDELADGWSPTTSLDSEPKSPPATTKGGAAAREETEQPVLEAGESERSEQEVQQQPEQEQEQPRNEEAAQEQDSAAQQEQPQRSAVGPSMAVPDPPARRTPLEFTGEAVQLKKFPAPLLKSLREVLTARAGAQAASAVSNTALVAAWTAASLGADAQDYDETTAWAVRAFALEDERLARLESAQREVVADLQTLAGAVSGLAKVTRRMEDTVSNVEFSTAYVVADRVGLLPLEGVDEASVDVTQPQVLTTRKSIRDRAAAQRRAERNSEGRRIS